MVTARLCADHWLVELCGEMAEVKAEENAPLERRGTIWHLQPLKHCTKTWLLHGFSFVLRFSKPDFMGLTGQGLRKSSFCWLPSYLRIFPYGIAVCLLLTSPALVS